MKSHQQKMHHSVVIPLLVFESDYLDFVELKGLLPAHIFSFFWGQLSDYEKFDVVQYYFLDLYRYLLYHEDGVPLIFAILREWNPTVAPLEYFKLLRLANDTNNFDLFALLWTRKLAVLSFEAIGHLMWVRVSVDHVQVKVFYLKKVILIMSDISIFVRRFSCGKTSISNYLS